jgi:ParB family chromosome partitioning protein
MAKPALGRGLGVLFGGNPPLTQPAPTPSIQPVVAVAIATDNRERMLRVPLHRIRPSALQPRKEFSEEALRELADSIREQGIVQPLIVRERGGFFELIAGERRWRAAQLLNLLEVPVIARDADDRAVLELALIENLQRENINAIEDARLRAARGAVSTHAGRNRAQGRQEPRRGRQCDTPAEIAGCGAKIGARRPAVRRPRQSDSWIGR